MAKYRIIEYRTAYSHWYEVEYKNFLFWYSLDDVYGEPTRFSNSEQAKIAVNSLKYGTKREVVYQDKD